MDIGGEFVGSLCISAGRWRPGGSEWGRSARREMH